MRLWRAICDVIDPVARHNEPLDSQGAGALVPFHTMLL